MEKQAIAAVSAASSYMVASMRRKGKTPVEQAFCSRVMGISESNTGVGLRIQSNMGISEGEGAIRMGICEV